MDELTRRRLAHNEELFRQVNEAREASSEGGEEQRLTFVCECSDRECSGRIEMSAAEFEQIRQRPDRYIVLPGHEIAEIERIVDDRGAFEVVKKDVA